MSASDEIRVQIEICTVVLKQIVKVAADCCNESRASAGFIPWREAGKCLCFARRSKS